MKPPVCLDFDGVLNKYQGYEKEIIMSSFSVLDRFQR